MSFEIWEMEMQRENFVEMANNSCAASIPVQQQERQWTCCSCSTFARMRCDSWSTTLAKGCVLTSQARLQQRQTCLAQHPAQPQLVQHLQSRAQQQPEQPLLNTLTQKPQQHEGSRAQQLNAEQQVQHAAPQSCALFSDMPGRAGKLVARGVPRLRSLIAALPQAERRARIEKLSINLRRVLIWFMESASQQKACTVTGMSPPSPVHKPIKKKPCRPAGRQIRRTSGAQAPAAAQNAGVLTLRTAWGPWHCARIVVGGIAISSQYTRNFEEAASLRVALARLAAQCRGEDHTVLEAALSKMTCLGAGCGDSGGTCANAHQRPQLRFRATVDARRWVGKILSSPQVFTIAEALIWHQRFSEARKSGWEQLQAEWVQCASTSVSSGRFGRRAKGAEEALAQLYANARPRGSGVHECNGGARARTKSSSKATCSGGGMAPRAPARERTQTRLNARRLERLERLVARLEVALQRCVADERKRKRPGRSRICSMLLSGNSQTALAESAKRWRSCPILAK